MGNGKKFWFLGSDLVIPEYPVTFESRIQSRLVLLNQKLSKLLLLAGCIAFTPLAAQTGCIQNVAVHTIPVQCNTFRNGSIVIDSVVGGMAPYYYSIDGLTFSTRPVFDFLWAEEYHLVVRDSLGCEYYLTVEVTEPPELTVDLTASVSLVPIGGSVQLYATFEPPSAQITSIDWRPPLLFDDSNSLYQKVNINETTTFAIELRDTNGCTARDQVVVEVEKPNIYVPNVILMGSNNDAYFTVFTDETIDIINLLRIYSRDGGMVFERQNFQPNDPLLGWNGRLKGKKVQPGVFTWLMQVTYPDGSIHQETGTLTVLR